jgi:hypothetical protein
LYRISYVCRIFVLLYVTQDDTSMESKQKDVFYECIQMDYIANNTTVKLRFEVRVYCGVAPKGRSIERPLLINGYASSSGFIGNDCKPTQRQLRNIGNMSEVHFLTNTIDRCLGDRSTNRKTLSQQLNALNQQWNS